MDQRSKYKSQNYKSLRRKFREKLHDIGFGGDFLDDTKSTRKEGDWLDFVKINFFVLKDSEYSEKATHGIGEKI